MAKAALMGVQAGTQKFRHPELEPAQARRCAVLFTGSL